MEIVQVHPDVLKPLQHLYNSHYPNDLHRIGTHVGMVARSSLINRAKGPERAVILQGVKLPEKRTWSERLRPNYLATIVPDERHPFNMGFKLMFEIEHFSELENSAPVNFAGLSVEYVPLYAGEDYTTQEIEGMVGPVPLPGVRVLFVPKVSASPSAQA